MASSGVSPKGGRHVSEDRREADVRPARLDDVERLAVLRHELWPEGSIDQHRGEVERLISGEFPWGPWTVLVAERDDGALVGFAEASVRPFAEGCETEGVAFLEGWFVHPEVRGDGVGRALVKGVEDWGRGHGCLELASDTHPGNAVSLAAHIRTGFDDVGLVRCFRKRI